MFHLLYAFWVEWALESQIILSWFRLRNDTFNLEGFFLAFLFFCILEMSSLRHLISLSFWDSRGGQVWTALYPEFLSVPGQLSFPLQPYNHIDGTLGECQSPQLSILGSKVSEGLLCPGLLESEGSCDLTSVSQVIRVFVMGFSASDGKESACNAGDLCSILGSGKSPGEGNGSPLQYSCLENPMDRGVWWATVHGITKSQTRLSD